MKKISFACLVALGLIGGGRYAQAQVSPSSVPADRSSDEKAIKALLDTFTQAFNAGDANTVAATYTGTALLIDEAGDRVEGQAAIKSRYAESFAANPGSKISIQVDSLKFLSSHTAIEQGKATITSAAGAPEVTKFTTIYVKEFNGWSQSVVRDELVHDATPHEHLKDLEWLVGEWVNESQDAIVHTTCTWAKGGNFLDREFTVKTAGRPVLSGTQRIGWDPLKKQFKTWIFDSEGGHGEGHFSHSGNQWVVKVEGVNQLGQSITATNIITRLGKDRLGWQSSNRTVGGTAVPGVNEFVVVRKPPEPTK